MNSDGSEPDGKNSVILGHKRLWTNDEDRRIAAMYEEDKLGPIAIAQIIGRPLKSVSKRLTVLRQRGLIGAARGHGGRSRKSERQHPGKSSEIEWRPVPGYAGYAASKTGQILGPSGQVLRPMPNPSGHLYILTRRPGVPRKLFVHRAVLMAWKGMPLQGQEGRHLNDIQSENNIDNLEWGTRRQNVDDKKRNGRIPRGEKCVASKLTEADVLEIRRLVKVHTLRELAKRYGVSHTAIRRAANGMNWEHL